jgi:HAMP domain-containing protein
MGKLREYVMTRLRVRTAALFLLGGVVPVLLTGLAAWSKFETDQIGAIVEEHRRLIQQVSADVTREIAGYREQLERLGRQTNVQAVKAERMQTELAAFLVFNPLFYRVQVYGATGALVASSTRGAQLEATGPAATLPEFLKPAFDLALKERKSSILPMASGDREQVQLCFLACIPGFSDEQPPVGAVISMLRLHGPEIEALLDRQKSLEGGAYVLLTDPAGWVIARAGSGYPAHLRSIEVTPEEAEDEDEAPVGSDLLLPKVVEPRDDSGRASYSLQSTAYSLSAGEARAGRLVTGTGRVAGRQDLLATAVLPAVGLHIVAGKPYAVVTRAMLELVKSIALYLAAGVLLAALLGLYLSAGLIGPILRLVDGIQRVARGEVAHRLEVEREDELGQAALAFNEMATQLEKGRLLEELWQSRRPLREQEPETD